MHKTMMQIITETERALFMSAGRSVQLYAQDLIMQFINDCFVTVLDKPRFWPMFRVRVTKTLDGVNGFTTTPLTEVSGFQHIQAIFRPDCNEPLKVLGSTINTLHKEYTTGTVPKFYTYHQANLIQVLPITSNGQILVVGAKIPGPFQHDDVVPFDALTLRLYACYMYTMSDGSNPDAAEAWRVMFQERLQTVTNAFFDGPIDLNSQDDYPRSWLVS